MSGPVVIDAAGGDLGGAARWHGELAGHLEATGSRIELVPLGDAPVRVIGLARRLTASWLVRRERLAAGADLVVAPNNAAFAFAGRCRVVLAVNALHYLHPGEEHALAGFGRAWRSQIPVVRRLVRRADLVVVPCADMADRVAYHVPSVASRIAVRPHPVTPVEVAAHHRAGPAAPPFILVPVVPGPYKNLFPQVRLLLEAAGRLSRPPQIRVTAAPDQLPPDLRGRVTALGVMPFTRLAVHWSTASAVFFPSTIEAFGYPLAEARAYGVPVIAPRTRQAVEIAGGALRPYDPDRVGSLVDAILAAAEPAAADPEPFNRANYFRWLLDPFATPPRTATLAAAGARG